MWFPSVEFILQIYKRYISECSKNLLNIQGLKTTLDKSKFGIPYHSLPSIWDSVTILYKEIVENHYFLDGNQRIGSLIAVLFLNFNEFQFIPPVGDIYKVTMDVAQVKKSFEDIKNWFQQNSKKIEN
ncbi:MAG: type II toxin-antitoxin system death-on-curing family toxin [Promethearchaeota archaeon]